MRLQLFLLGFLLAACSPSPQPMQTPAPLAGDGEETSVTGTVRVVGSAPVNVQTVLQEGDAPSVRVTGPLTGEIERLSGARVTVWGRIAGGAVEAERYEVVSVDGRPVVTGVVERAPGGGLQLRTDRGEVLRLDGADAHLRVGQKVWVQGPATVQLQSFGVIRP